MGSNDGGEGGAERLVVDAAVALQERGDDVVIYTSHCSPSHSFRETQDGTLRVVVMGDWLPKTVGGRFKAFFAYLRMIYVALWMIFSVPIDVAILDQVSLPIPLFKWAGIKVGPPALPLSTNSLAQTLFYCHYPDKLLTQRATWVKFLYRFPIDWMEEWTTGQADEVLVNSKFTAGVFRESFPSIRREPTVLYPAINFTAMKRGVDAQSVLERHGFLQKDFFLSINRFERKKNISLAVEAFSVLKTILSEDEFDGLHLVIAGGYDPQLPENREVFNELKTLVSHEDLTKSVTFMPSFSDEEKESLLSTCFAVIYTPSNEHFGIVPVEGMYFEKVLPLPSRCCLIDLPFYSASDCCQ